MLGIFAILLIAMYMVFVFPLFKNKKAEEKPDEKTAIRVKKLWGIAQTSMRERKPIRAEKALLAILKMDEKNAAAYNRLGILYAKSQKFNEAIECFEIAQSLDNNASSLHNVGLIYLETGEYEKAAMAFNQALELEGDMPARYIALAKAEEKLGNRKNALSALESAYGLDHSLSTLRQILAIHEAAGDTEAITETTARIEARIAENATKKSAKKPRRSLYPRRINRTATRPMRTTARTTARSTTVTTRTNAARATTARAQAARPIPRPVPPRPTSSRPVPRRKATPRSTSPVSTRHKIQ